MSRPLYQGARHLGRSADYLLTRDEEMVPSLDDVREILGITPRSEEMDRKARKEIAQLKKSQAKDLSLVSWPGVYRLWAENDDCLYVGKSAQRHPILRIIGHCVKSWWDEVARADFIPCPRHLLDEFERYQIFLLNPKHNKQRQSLKEPRFWLCEEPCE